MLIKFYFEIVEVSQNQAYALFKRNDDEYGWLEICNGELVRGDILEEIAPRSFLKCGIIDCVINGRAKAKINVQDYGPEDYIRNEYNRWK